MSPEIIDSEMDDECKRLVASIALEASNQMTLAKRIMINRGIAAIFPNASPEHHRASSAARALACAEKQQLTLTNLLEG